MADFFRLIIGLGKTGWSAARYFSAKGLSFRVMDTRMHPPLLADFKRHFPKVPVYAGGINLLWLRDSQEIILSPGIDPKLLGLPDKKIKAAIYSDIDLFNRVANAPIIAITGSNGKSTVTVLIHYLLTKTGRRVQVGGNLGIPVLDLLTEPPPDFYVLELSSFQLSITKKLKTAVSVFLNLATDHLDRHIRLADYCQAKQNIYRDCEVAVWNRDEQATYPQYKVPTIINFGVGSPTSKQEFGIEDTLSSTWLVQGKTDLVEIKSLKITGRHNYANVLAALAALQAVHCPFPPLLQALIHFQELPHRLELVCTQRGVKWINDSKATNSHATQAALSSFTEQDRGKVILIAGGIYKSGDNLNVLNSLLLKYTKQVILIGQDANVLKKNFIGIVPIEIASSLTEAVTKASNYTVGGDTILLSPACSSQDMFKDYEERGDCFKRSIKQLLNLDKIL